MENQASQQSIDRVERLLKEHLIIVKRIESQNNKIQKRLRLMVIGGYIKLSLVLIPIILGIIYIPAFIKDVQARVNTIPFLSVSQDGSSKNSFIDMLSSFSGGQINQDDINKLLQKIQ